MPKETKSNLPRLGVNIDHVATIRNARGGVHPDPVNAALLAARAGADGITVHLREDRRHISDEDLQRLRSDIDLPVNLEMAATDEMLAIALHHIPNAVCIVPERREERTTEGGLDAAMAVDWLKPFVRELNDNGIRVSLFVEPNSKQIEAALRVGAPVIELHTGGYCNASGMDRERALNRIVSVAELAINSGIECHAGHGLTFDNVSSIAAIPSIQELNIGHFLIGEAIFCGLDSAIRRMRRIIDDARGQAVACRTDESVNK